MSLCSLKVWTVYCTVVDLTLVPRCMHSIDVIVSDNVPCIGIVPWKWELKIKVHRHLKCTQVEYKINNFQICRLPFSNKTTTRVVSWLGVYWSKVTAGNISDFLLTSIVITLNTLNWYLSGQDFGTMAIRTALLINSSTLFSASISFWQSSVKINVCFWTPLLSVEPKEKKWNLSENVFVEMILLRFILSPYKCYVLTQNVYYFYSPREKGSFSTWLCKH